MMGRVKEEKDDEGGGWWLGGGGQEGVMESLKKWQWCFMHCCELM